MRFRGADIRRFYVKSSGISYTLEMELAATARAYGVGLSEFQGWPVPDQCRAIAYERARARIDAVVAQEAQREAEQKSKGRGKQNRMK